MSNFNLPDLGEGLAEAEIVRWHVKTGDHINADDPLLAVETAKAIVEVPSPLAGTIKAIHGNPGDTVATGALLVEFEPDAPAAGTRARASTAGPTGLHQQLDAGTVVGKMPTGDDNFLFDGSLTSGSATNSQRHSTVSADAPSDRVRAVPAARALATRLGLDLTQIQGTGRGQLITVEDVLRMTSAPTGFGSREAAASGSALQSAGAHAPHRNTAGASAAQPTSTEPQQSGERLKGPRRAMAQSMASSRSK